MNLARVSIATPQRRMDLTVPEYLTVAELLPTVVEQVAGGGTFDGIDPPETTNDGWVLRRLDGAALVASQTLGDAAIRDGETLHLAPASTRWPEPEYDDLAAELAETSDHPLWSAGVGRVVGLSAVVAVALTGVGILAASGGGGSAAATFVVALVGLGAGVALSRAVGDATAGAVIIGSVAMPAGFLCGPLLIGWQAAGVLAGAVVLATMGVLSYLGVADPVYIPVVGVVAGVGGAAGAGLSLLGLSPAGAAAVVLTAMVLVIPVIPLAGVRLGRLPMPQIAALPGSSALSAVRADPPAGVASDDHAVEPTAAVARRVHDLIAAALSGCAGTALVAAVIAVPAGVVAWLLVVLSAVLLGLRARAFPALYHRLPLLTASLAGGVVAAAGVAAAGTQGTRAWVSVGLVVAAGLLAAVVLRRARPAPYVDRVADLTQTVAVVAMIPVMAATCGFFGWMRGLGG